jgi:hypothetical protein
MEKVVQELRELVTEFSVRFTEIPDADFSAKPIPHQWSKKEIVGHLIDSAQTNLRRFICGQYETTPSKIIYEQNFWVAANQYQSRPRESVIELWKLINTQIILVLASMPPDQYEAQSMTNELHTLAWLAEDYVRHMKHHLEQIVPGSFVTH